MGYLVSYPPLFRVLLQDQEDVDQILACGLLEELNEFGEMGDSSEFEEIGTVFEDIIQSCKHILF